MKSILVGLCCAGAFATPAQTMTALGNLPLYFEANPGQANSPVRFLARGRDCQFLISPNESQLILRKTDTISGKVSSCAVRMQFVNANAQARICGDAEQPGKINYLIGSDPAQWRTGVATFAQVRVEQLYPGIGLIYYGNQQQLEYDFTIAPHANSKQIAIQFTGADKISISPRGELILTIGKDEVYQPKPLLYQTVDGAREEISGGYRIVDAHTVAFDIGKYNPALPLVIDPILSYSTYFGGNAGETAWAISMDTNGFIYVAGNTFSTNFFIPGAFQTNYQGASFDGDAFVAKFSNGGSNLVYLTYLGGNGNNLAASIAVDGAGDAFVTGFTDAANFPTTNALYSQIAGTNIVSRGKSYGYYADAFVSELNTNGSGLVYSTYLGGSGLDAGLGIALDPAGNAYVTGLTASTNFPTTNALVFQLAGSTNPVLNHLAGSYNAFVAKIGSGGSPLVYSTYFGGTNFDEGESIAVDDSGCAYVTGFTDSTNFPVSTNALSSSLNNFTNNTFDFAYDAFVAKFAPSGTNLVYSTFLGGTNDDVGYHVTHDAAGNAYVTGFTTSPDFPNTATNVPGLHSFVFTNVPGAIVVTNAFLTAINSNGTALVYSAVFGGNAGDFGYGVAVDPTGNAFVVGTTSSADFPTFNTSGLLRATNSGGNDVFVVAFNTNASALLYSTYLGGLSDDFGYGIAVDPAGNAYIVGQTASMNFPTLDAFQSALNGVSDAFLAKILLQQPTLTLINNSGNAILTWPSFEPEFALESNTNLLSSNDWVTVPLSCVLTNGLETITLPATNNDLFFRLHKF